MNYVYYDPNDPYSYPDYGSYVDAGQAYINNYAGDAATPVDQPAAASGGGVGGTIGGLAGTATGAYGVHALWPSAAGTVGTAGTGAGIAGAGAAGAMTPINATTMTAATPWAGLSSSSAAAPTAAAGLGTTMAGLSGAMAPLVVGALWQNYVTGGRSNYEKEKDPFRDQLVESGFLSPNFQYLSPSGQSYDFGVSGSKKPQVDLSDPIQADLYGKAQDLVKNVFQGQFDNINNYHNALDRDVAAGYGLFGGSNDAVREGKRGYAWADNRRDAQNQELTNDMASYFTGAAAQGAPDIAAANQNFWAMANQLGYKPDKDKK